MGKKINIFAAKFEHGEDPDYPECVAKHLPKWVDELDWNMFRNEIDEPEYDRLRGLVNRYNELIDLEESGIDAHEQFGIENEKRELIEDMVKIYEGYKHLKKQ